MGIISKEVVPVAPSFAFPSIVKNTPSSFIQVLESLSNPVLQTTETKLVEMFELKHE
jgi:hypothetical protein